MPYAGGGRRVEQGDALADLGVEVRPERGGHREQRARAVQGGGERGRVVEVGANQFGAKVGKFNWVAIFAEDSEDELTFLLKHMNRTVDLSHRQIARLAEKDL